MAASERGDLMLGFRLGVLNWNFMFRLSPVSEVEYNARTDPKESHP